MLGILKRLVKGAAVSTILSRRVLNLAPNVIDRLRHDTRFLAGASEPEVRMLFAVMSRISESRAQLFQDIWVLDQTNWQRDGFFVEVGAFDGEKLSNTWLLENSFGWRGILVEPDPRHREALRKRAKSLVCDRCVTARSGDIIDFWATSTPELSTIGRFANNDYHAFRRAEHETLRLETISLVDLLDTFNAPPIIDYLSIDTEGSEYEILEPFEFTRYDVRLITVEHNHGPNESRLHALLTSRGYHRVLPAWSQFESWYVKHAGM